MRKSGIRKYLLLLILLGEVACSRRNIYNEILNKFNRIPSPKNVTPEPAMTKDEYGTWKKYWESKGYKFVPRSDESDEEDDVIHPNGKLVCTIKRRSYTSSIHMY